MKALIEIDRNVWAKVKDFATVEDEPISSAVQCLLSDALNKLGYSVAKGRKRK